MADARPYADPWFGEFGAQRRAGENLDLGAFVDLRGRIGRFGAVREATAFGAWRLGAERKQWHLTRGRSPASPAWRHRF